MLAILFAMAAAPFVGVAVVCRAVVRSVEKGRRADAVALVATAGILALYGVAAAGMLLEAQR